MRAAPVYAFIAIMWGLILLGGWMAVTVLGPFSVSGYGELDPLLSSGIKAAVAVLLAVLWIVILARIKNWLFGRLPEQ